MVSRTKERARDPLSVPALPALVTQSTCWLRSAAASDVLAQHPCSSTAVRATDCRGALKSSVLLAPSSRTVIGSYTSRLKGHNSRGRLNSGRSYLASFDAAGCSMRHAATVVVRATFRRVTKPGTTRCVPTHRHPHRSHAPSPTRSHPHCPSRSGLPHAPAAAHVSLRPAHLPPR